MNIYPKIFLSIFATIILLNYAWSNDSTIIKDDVPENPCVDARLGTLDLNLVEYHNPSYYSFLFNCSITTIIPYLNESKISVEKRIKKKLKLANALLKKELDIKYNDEYASTLLMSVVLSSLPKKWKVKVVKLLISKGSDIQAKNIYGYTALDSAKFVKDTEIIKILSSYSK